MTAISAGWSGSGKRALFRITVRGTRKDGTIGPIKITGFPVPEYEAVEAMLKKRIAKLGILEDELQEAVSAVDDYIAAIPKSDLRQMFRLYYLDDLTWAQVGAEHECQISQKEDPLYRGQLPDAP